MHETPNVDQTLSRCLDLKNPRSFFLFAGAGSGKTRSLVNVLRDLKTVNGASLRLCKQRVAVITYTNAACDEILRRVDFDPIFKIATIHSFAWTLINTYQLDIKDWLRINLAEEIADLEQKQTKGRAGTKAALDRAKKIESKSKRLETLEQIRAFTYNPNGDNFGKDSLNHSEVIKITAYLLTQKPLMRNVLTRSYPFVLVDESQDTNRDLMEAFLFVQKSCKTHFSLGLFGDTMQRIYADGKPDLGVGIPDDWETPAKEINHRCPKRVIRLINRIRQDVDQQQQIPRGDKEDGFVRLFIAPSSSVNKQQVEKGVAGRMAEITGDSLWSGEDRNIKILTLEHHMAANRMGFLDLFEPLYRTEHLRTGLIEGRLSGLNFFRDLILPLVNARRDGNEFGIARVVRHRSPLLSRDSLRKSEDQKRTLGSVKQKVDDLLNMWSERSPRLIDVLYRVSETELFSIPESLAPIAARRGNEKDIASLQHSDEDEESDEGLDAWDSALSSTFDQLQKYDEYISERGPFSTHQGVKGLEFPRVMVILDDEEARGFLFSYEKLFGAAPLSDADHKNLNEGKETSIDRTRRLFYVTCSRAERGLAVVAYTGAPESVKRHALSHGWFIDGEIELLS